MKYSTRLRRLFFEHCEDRLLLADTSGGTPSTGVEAETPAEVSRRAGEGGFNYLSNDRALSFGVFLGEDADGVVIVRHPYADRADTISLDRANNVVGAADNLVGTASETSTAWTLDTQLHSLRFRVSSDRLAITQTPDVEIRTFDETELPLAAAPAPSAPTAPAALEAVAATGVLQHASQLVPGSGFSAQASEGGFANVAILRPTGGTGVSAFTQRDPRSAETSLARNSSTEAQPEVSGAELLPSLAWNWRVDAAHTNAVAFDVASSRHAPHSRAEPQRGAVLLPASEESPVEKQAVPDGQKGADGDPAVQTVSADERDEERANVASQRRPYFRSAPFIIAAIGTLLSKDYWQKLQPRRDKQRRSW